MYEHWNYAILRSILIIYWLKHYMKTNRVSLIKYKWKLMTKYLISWFTAIMAVTNDLMLGKSMIKGYRKPSHSRAKQCQGCAMQNRWPGLFWIASYIHANASHGRGSSNRRKKSILTLFSHFNATCEHLCITYPLVYEILSICSLSKGFFSLVIFTIQPCNTLQ
jgi:hypothetical protein